MSEHDRSLCSREDGCLCVCDQCRRGDCGISGLHRTLMSAFWTDAEPDTLTISVQTDTSTGEPFIVFTGSCTWLPAQVVRDEVIPWLAKCEMKVREVGGR